MCNATLTGGVFHSYKLPPPSKPAPKATFQLYYSIILSLPASSVAGIVSSQAGIASDVSSNITYIILLFKYNICRFINLSEKIFKQKLAF